MYTYFSAQMHFEPIDKPNPISSPAIAYGEGLILGECICAVGRMPAEQRINRKTGIFNLPVIYHTIHRTSLDDIERDFDLVVKHPSSAFHIYLSLARLPPTRSSDKAGKGEHCNTIQSFGSVEPM